MHKERTSELFIFSEAFLWAFYPIVSSILVLAFSPVFALAVSTLAAAVFFGTVVALQKRWHELFIKQAWKYLIPMILLMGILLYGLLFFSLQYTTPGNVSIISLMEVFFTMVLLGAVTKHETLSRVTIIGGALMVIGAFFVIFQGSLKPNPGDMLVLLAMAVPPFGNLMTKKVRSYMSAATLMFARSTIAGIFLLFLAWVLGDIPNTMPSWGMIGLIALNGFVLLGFSKILWIEGIHRIQISKAISLSSINPAITLFFAFVILHQRPTLFQVLGLVPIMAGVWLLTRRNLVTE